MFTYIFKGVILGFSIAAPVGPVNLLCMRRTLMYGKKAGLISGFGSALADAFFAVVAGYGFTAVSRFLSEYETYFHVGGGIILVFIAWKIFTSKTVIEKYKDQSAKTLWKYFISTFLLTLTNPAALFTFIALFSTFRVHNTFLLVLGVFFGAMAWWTLLTYSVAHIHISNSRFLLINKIAAALIALIGIISIFM